MTYDRNALYNLLPAVYRERDAALNYPLRGLLSLITTQANLLDGDIAQLYNNLFIETCADWVIPYIGDLVSNNLLFDSSRIHTADTAQALFPDLQGRDLRPPVAVPIRADVAKTIYYRQRKATPRMLEELAHDVTGWPAHVVEFFQHLGWTQNMEHIRYECQTTDVRSLDAMDRIDGAFDETMHTVDVRQISQQEGWYNIRNIGFFLWRVNSYPLERVPARQASQPWQYHFSPLGNPAPLFTRLRPEPAGGGLVTEIDISAPIRPTFFYQDLENYRLTPPPRPDFTELYGAFNPVPADPTISSETSFFIFLNGQPINPVQDTNAQTASPWRAGGTFLVGQFIVDSNNKLEQVLGILATISNVQISLNTLTITANNNYAAGTTVTFSNVATATFLNGQSVVVLSATPTQFTATFVHADYASTPDSGTCLAGSGSGTASAVEPIWPTITGNSVDDGNLRWRLTSIPFFQPQISCAVLDPWPAAQPKGSVIKIDVERGRMAIGDGFGVTSPVDVFFFYGFSANMGGGPYDRRKWLIRRDLNPAPRVYQVEEGGVAPIFPNVTAAVLQWQADLRPDAIISILDSRNYQLPNSITLRNEGWLAIEAADGQRPLLLARSGMTVDVSPPVAPGDLDRNGVLTLSGVVLEGFLHVIGDLGQLRVLHSTLVPGRALDETGKPVSSNPSLIVEGKNGAGQTINTELKVEVAYSILGGLFVPENVTGIWILDSIIDGAGADAILGPAPVSGPPGPGPSAPLKTERSTFFGQVLVKSLEASEVIFNGFVDAQRTQDGCVRFSYVPPGSHVPRRYRCQPDLEIEQEIADAFKRNPLLTAAEQTEITNFVEGWLVPSFKAHSYGSPFYAQLHLGCPEQIRSGAEDGSEMGVFSNLKQPQRESNLKIRLQEYLPFGLEAGIIYVT